MIKGVIIEKAMPSNIVDIYSLVKESVKENCWEQMGPTKDSVKEYYFQLLNELQNPAETTYLARRGRTYWGFAQVQVMYKPLEKTASQFLKYIYVVPKKRTLGIGRGLLDRIKEDSLKMGIKKVELLTSDKNVDMWIKKSKATKVMNLMSYSLE